MGGSRFVWLSSLAGVIVAGGLGAVFATNPLPTTINDFYLRGTQPTPPFIEGEPNPAMRELLEPAFCAACHGEYAEAEEPYARWQHSMMGQAFRDPVFRAAFSIAQQDAPGSGDTCLRCHAPAGWIQDRNVPSDGSALNAFDKDGVTCHACHRMVDPIYRPGISPVFDQGVLEALGADAPDGNNSNSYVIDPKDRRRGPFDISPQEPHPWLQSPFHTDSSMCASCHDTSNPAFMRQPDGSYAPTGYDAPHPTLDKYDMFPEQRTYSEWLASDFADGQVDLGSNRFGGQVIVEGQVVPRTTYSSCQDCHMPTTTGTGCNPFIGGPVRTNLPQHNFNGANTWVLNAVNNLYDSSEHHMVPDLLADSIARNVAMLQQASDLELTQVGSQVVARVINQTGHKLPTGYPEGRRMWVNVRFFDGSDMLIAERGHYDSGAATLTVSDTKVYETEHGFDQVVATATGRTPGPSFHLALNNYIEFDNRIPPRGFTLAEFESVQAQPVGYVYADGQYWDDTAYDIPAGAARAEVRVFFQTSSREYMEFLRDEDTTIPFDREIPWGTLAYQQWELLGRSAPVEMDFASIVINQCAADFNGDGFVDPDDLGDFINCYFSVPPCPEADFNADSNIDPDDLGDFINTYFAGCP
ncbi:MAG: multiheme c-type cytochrome [Phycisphaerales bacterium]